MAYENLNNFNVADKISVLAISQSEEELMPAFFLNQGDLRCVWLPTTVLDNLHPWPNKV